LEQELDNPHDPNAIMVSRSNGSQVGYLNRHLSKNLAPYFEKLAGPVRGRVKYVTGSVNDGYSLGLVIQFKIPRLVDRFQRFQKHVMDWED